MRKAGRFTAALLLMAVGAAVITDKLTGSRLTGLLIEWWPVLFIALGLEYIVFNMRYGDSDRQLKLDIGGVIFAVLLSAVVVGSTQSTDVFRNWFGHVNFNQSIRSGEGSKFEKPPVSIPVSPALERITVVNHTNGNVTLKPGTADQLQVEMTVYVAEGDQAKAAEIANQVELKQNLGSNKLELAADAKEYNDGPPWAQKRPAIDLVILVPARLHVDMDLEMSNGKFTADQLAFKNNLKVRTTNGEIEVTSVTGDLDLESTNAAIKTANTKGRMQLETTNGPIVVDGHQGDAKLESTNGNLLTTAMTGSIQAETTNGDIVVIDAPQELKAHTTNGSVEVTSRSVNGDWDVETNHGKIVLKLPANGDYSVKGKGQADDIETALPLQVRKDKIEGRVGSGKHDIRLDTRGSISIQKAD